MTTLTISDVSPTKSGKSLSVKANGKNYLARTNSGITAGMTIEAEIETSEWQGKTLEWIGPYVQVKAPESSPGIPANTDRFWLPMTSNVVAHAIQAGLIKSPDEIKVWVGATRSALRDEDIPF